MKTLMLVFLLPFTLWAANLILDPSFEKGGNAWTFGNAEVTTDPTINGEKVCITQAGAEGSVSQIVTVEPGKSYVLMAWIKVGEWDEIGWLKVRLNDDEEIDEAISHANWHLYALPFVAKANQVTVGWYMGPNTKGSRCDMFMLSEYEELLEDGGLENGGIDLFRWNMWNWGAELSDWEPRSGAMGMKADPVSGGGFGYYPDIFEPGEIIIAAAWIRTGDNSSYAPGYRDHVSWRNLGWWAVRKERHVTEINIELSDVGWHQYVIPYKIPLEGFNPEILWWQQSGESESYLDDMMLFRSPYKDNEIPWQLIAHDPEGTWNIWPDPNDPTWPITPEVKVKEKPAALPASFELGQNFPNPFNSETVIDFHIFEPGHVRLEIFDIHGHKVAAPVDEFKAPGSHQVRLNSEDLASGVFFYRFQFGNEWAVRKMTVLE